MKTRNESSIRSRTWFRSLCAQIWDPGQFITTRMRMRVVLIILMIGIMGSLNSRWDQELTHICAYSNESVVKFREKFLTDRAAFRSMTHPGIQMDWPVDLCEFWISSLYGMRRNKMHNGIDMAALKGTEVKAAADGVVKSVVKQAPGYGNMIDIDHKKSGLMTRYAHLDRIDVSEGKQVKKGQIIGRVGATGNVRGADPSHLHFEIFKDGQRVDPLKYLYSAEINYKNLKKNSIWS